MYVILQVGRLDEAIVHTKEILDKGKFKVDKNDISEINHAISTLGQINEDIFYVHNLYDPF